MTQLRIGELFAGYGGLALAIEGALGAKLAWVSEYERGPSRILAHHWPDVPNHGDIRKIDWSQVEPVDIIGGGYPCQPFSLIGRRAGTAHAQHLWPHALEAVRHIRPRYAVFENVPGHLSLGFDTVLGDLAEIGYDTQWTTVRASTIGAPHRRERLFIVATDTRRQRLGQHAGESPKEEARAQAGHESADHSGIRTAEVWGPYSSAVDHWGRLLGRPAPHPIDQVVTAERSRENLRVHEWMMGLPDGWVTGVPGLTRREASKALGNGVIPRQATEAIRHLLQVSEVPA